MNMCISMDGVAFIYRLPNRILKVGCWLTGIILKVSKYETYEILKPCVYNFKCHVCTSVSSAMHMLVLASGYIYVLMNVQMNLG